MTKRRPVEILTSEEVDKLIGACNPKAPSGARNRALIAVLYRAGLRIGEALALKPKDLDESAATVRILHGKGDKARTVGMDEAGFAFVALWLLERRRLSIRNSTPLFCQITKGKRGQPISYQYVAALLPRLAKRAGVDKRVHAHGLRHTYACELRAEGVDPGLISRLLGHVSIATTARYLDHVAPQAAIEAARNRRWGANGNGRAAEVESIKEAIAGLQERLEGLET
jgi:site-specific recombinase XerD